ncbi:zinc finger protein 791-like [Aricia agestis]|uniref:zinc finger protein 791-like n=1 Tax=Aricia agestis TaxID=91739 RepID=UPI001C207CA2|nr:zinc finger protein 791-like [Aricia agestis]XP_041968730.1 zinc finger protein 791-like [Aricia agestis]
MMAEDFDPLSYGCAVYNQFMSCQDLANCIPIDQQLTNGGQLDQNVHNAYENTTQPHLEALANYSNNEDVKPDISATSRKKKNGRLKNMSVKISQPDFKFYGCSLCNICYPTLPELDVHVASHNDRITSYDLRIKNQIKRRKLKKETKKLKKLKDIVKKENDLLDVEIKPEDGYIGTEKANEINNSKEKEPTEERDVTNGQNDPNELNASDPNELIAKKQELLNLQKIYKCFACFKQFSLSYYLKLHVRSHTDEKPYVCAQCGQSFITASKLGRHNKRYHLAIKYQCRICYKLFCRFEFLTRHFDNKHAEHKLEGEPYDYNAILPYLKELEEQLREKEEEKDKNKVKTTDAWGDLWPMETPVTQEVKEEQMKEIEVPIKEEVFNPEPITIEEVKIDPIDSVEIKLELEETPREMEDCHSYDDDDDNVVDNKSDVKREMAKVEDDDEDVKNEATSDEDYFPTNTWVSSPKDEPPTKGKGKLECPVCHKTVSSASYMRVHMRTHSGERPYRCPHCDLAFITASKMHRHALTHPETWEDNVKPEVKTETEDGETDKKGKMKNGLANFLKKTKGEKKKNGYQKRPFSCEFCQKRFLHQATLQVHKKCHEGEPLVYKCTFCLAEQPDEAALRQHEAAHAGPKPYLCTVCGRTYAKRETMVYHRKSHAEHSPYICDVCTKGFSSAGKLERHLAGHRAARFVLRYECPVCAHMFHTRYHVQLHLNTHQREGLIREEDRPHVLAMVLQNARRLPRAGAADPPPAPPDERSRVCNICGEVFQHFYYLEEHLKSHGSRIAVADAAPAAADDRKHVCPVCSKSFKLHYYLKLHSFTHTKEKPFICQQCGKGFITRGKLKRHLETHSGLKKYQCHICCKFFTRPSYLRIHVRTIHGTQDYNFRLAAPRPPLDEYPPPDHPVPPPC